MLFRSYHAVDFASVVLFLNPECWRILFALSGWWASRDLNPEPTGYEPVALTVAPKALGARVFVEV